MGKPIDAPYICWIDLECTGNRDDDKIIEVGLAITDRQFVVQKTYSEVVGLSSPDRSFLVDRMEPVVRMMHHKNGLLRDLYEDHNKSMATIDAEISAMMKGLMGTNHMPLAGSGVMHFDRRYIKAEMPKTDKQLSYWALDVGVLRRWLDYFGIQVPDAVAAGEKKTHRALDDILAHIEEAKAYKAKLRECGWQR